MKKFIIKLVAFIVRLIFVPVAISLAAIFWILIGVLKPDALGKILIKTGENILVDSELLPFIETHRYLKNKNAKQ